MKFFHPLLISLLLAYSLASNAYEMSDEEHSEIRNFLRQSLAEDYSFNDRFDAEVWLLSQSNKLKRYIKDEKKRIHLLRNIHLEATRAALNPDIVLAVIQVESAFDR